MFIGKPDEVSIADDEENLSQWAGDNGARVRISARADSAERRVWHVRSNHQPVVCLCAQKRDVVDYLE